MDAIKCTRLIADETATYFSHRPNQLSAVASAQAQSIRVDSFLVYCPHRRWGSGPSISHHLAVLRFAFVLVPGLPVVVDQGCLGVF